MSKIVQLAGFIFSPHVLNITKAPLELTGPIINSFKKNAGVKKLDQDIFIEAGLNLIGKMIKKGISSITSSGITLTNNEIKDIMKVIKSLENRGILFKITARKITSQ